jgi:hypothetical protein
MQARQYISNWLCLLSQAANTLAGGDPRMTLSARMGHDILDGKCKACGFLCALLALIDPDHCENAWADELLAPNPVDQIVND